MQTKLNPYIGFKKEAQEAMEFYKTVFGGILELNTFKESGMSSNPDEDALIMHAMLTADNGMVLMASDTPSSVEYKPGTNMSISLSGENESELSTYFDKLSADGTVTQPLVEAPWGDTFGMVTDKFGIQWMVSIAKQND